MNEEKPFGTLKHNERLETFKCESCKCMFTQTYCEYWHWVYSEGGILLDENGKLVYDDNGRVIKKKYEWKLKRGGGFGGNHTLTIYCPFCGHSEKIKLNKKKFYYLKRRPPTEKEAENLEEA